MRFDAAGIKKRTHPGTGDYAGPGEIVANGSAFAVSMIDPESGMWKYHDESQVMLSFSDLSPVLTIGLVWRCDRAESNSGLHELTALADRVFRDADSGPDGFCPCEQPFHGVTAAVTPSFVHRLRRSFESPAARS